MMQILSFTNKAGRILATAGIPAEALTEGNHGDVITGTFHALTVKEAA